MDSIGIADAVRFADKPPVGRYADEVGPQQDPRSLHPHNATEGKTTTSSAASSDPPPRPALTEHGVGTLGYPSSKKYAPSVSLLFCSF